MRAKVLISLAPFKGTLTAEEACEVVAQALTESTPHTVHLGWGECFTQQEECEEFSGKTTREGPNPPEVVVEMKTIPVVDGGEGTGKTLGKLFGGKPITVEVHGPNWEKVKATYWMLEDGKAVMDMASASGLSLVPPEGRNPLNTTTYGTGEMMRDAMMRGAKEIWLGVGGSATVDGGLGLALALGVPAYSEGQSLQTGTGKELLSLTGVGSPPEFWRGKILIFTDVNNPLCGQEGAAVVYGPQKGAPPELVPLLDRALERWALLLEEKSGKALKNIPGMGAAGGIALPLVAFWDAELTIGAKQILDFLQYDRYLEKAHLVITGEGKIDWQTLYGKAPSEVIRRCEAHRIPCVVLCGQVGEGFDALYDAGVSAILPCFPCETVPSTSEEAKKRLRQVARGFFEVFFLLNHQEVKSLAD
ncbi:MAG: glycerate kinase family protein [bacterium JZ-2024 1]